MDTKDKISTQLDTIISLLKLTNRDALSAAREKLDDVSKALIEATAEPVVVGKLKKDVAITTVQSEKTVQRRIAELVVMGALAKDGGGSSATYRSTGLL
jgi:ATP-dependent Zn protease